MLAGCPLPDDGGGDDDGGGGGGGGVWTALTLPTDADGLDHTQDNVYGMFCSAPDRCVIGTDRTGNLGAVFSATTDEVTGVVLTAAQVNDAAGTDNYLGFTGFDQVNGRLAVRMTHSLAFVSASGDGTNASDWTIDGIGLDMKGLNSQVKFAEANGTWLYFRNGVVWSATQPPADNTQWTGMWSPGRVPPFPENYDELKADDDSICNADPLASTTVPQSSFATATSDLGVIMYPAGGLNQGGASAGAIDAPGVCVSTDGGATFRQVSFPADEIVDTDVGPRGITCTDNEHCWAFKAYQFGEDNPYLFYTTNASSGMSLTWSRGQLPAIELDGVTFRHVFFAPDNQHGWLVGDFDSRKPLLFATSDGGATWEDLSADVQVAMGDGELYTGFAVDADHIWIGGEKGALLASSSGGR